MGYDRFVVIGVIVLCSIGFNVFLVRENEELTDNITELENYVLILEDMCKTMNFESIDYAEPDVNVFVIKDFEKPYCRCMSNLNNADMLNCLKCCADEVLYNIECDHIGKIYYTGWDSNLDRNDSIIKKYMKTVLEGEKK